MHGPQCLERIINERPTSTGNRSSIQWHPFSIKGFTKETLVGKFKLVGLTGVENVEDPFIFGLGGLEDLQTAIEFGKPMGKQRWHSRFFGDRICLVRIRTCFRDPLLNCEKRGCTMSLGNGTNDGDCTRKRGMQPNCRPVSVFPLIRPCSLGLSCLHREAQFDRTVRVRRC